MNLLTKIFKGSQSLDERKNNAFMKGGRRKGENENPYLSARRTWNDYVGSIVSSRRMWQVVAIINLLIVLVAVGGMVENSGRSKYIPYIVEVDKLGQIVAKGPIASTTKADPRLLKTTVSEFITKARLVTPDIALQRTAIYEIYAHLSPNDPATQKMNEWLGDPKTNPFQRAKTTMVNIEISSIIPQTPDTWQADWVETVRNRSGGVDEVITLRGLFTIYNAEPSAGTTEQQLLMNPLGIYISDYSWQKLQ